MEKISIPNKRPPTTKDKINIPISASTADKTGNESDNRRTGKAKLSPNPKRPSILQRLAIQLNSKKGSNSPKSIKTTSKK